MSSFTGGGSCVVCSILEQDAALTESRLREVPHGCGLVEIRGDHLRAGEIAAAVRHSEHPVIVTVRREADGGHFDGSEDDRRRALEAALDAGAAFVDVEHESALSDLANGPHAARVILSHHDAPCRTDTLAELFAEMSSTNAARLKIVPACRQVSDIVAIRDLLRRTDGRLACFGLGRLGAVSRLLAPSWGSWATYGSVAGGVRTAPGQFSASEMLDLHDVLNIGPATRLFALAGRSVFGSPSPAMHRAGYLDSGIDARYLPIEADDAEDCLGLSGPGAALGIEALAVTMPFKHDAHARCKSLDEAAHASGAVNTVLGGPGGWRGCNTDGPAVLDIVRARFDPRGEAVAVVGAGGFARAAAVALRGAGADVVLFNRTRERAERVAQELGVTARPLDDLAKFEWTILVQATPLGLAGEDPLEGAPLRGKLILDAIYGPETPLLRRARLEGTDAVGGFDLLVGQAVRQFELMVGVRPSEAVMRSAGRGWLKVALTETSTGLTLKNRR